MFIDVRCYIRGLVGREVTRFASKYQRRAKRRCVEAELCRWRGHSPLRPVRTMTTQRSHLESTSRARVESSQADWVFFCFLIGSIGRPSTSPYQWVDWSIVLLPEGPTRITRSLNTHSLVLGVALLGPFKWSVTRMNWVASGTRAPLMYRFVSRLPLLDHHEKHRCQIMGSQNVRNHPPPLCGDRLGDVRIFSWVCQVCVPQGSLRSAGRTD